MSICLIEMCEITFKGEHSSEIMVWINEGWMARPPHFLLMHASHWQRAILQKSSLFRGWFNSLSMEIFGHNIRRSRNRANPSSVDLLLPHVMVRTRTRKKNNLNRSGPHTAECLYCLQRAGTRGWSLRRCFQGWGCTLKAAWFHIGIRRVFNDFHLYLEIILC